MGKLIRCISEDGSLMMMAADTADIVEEARRIHGTTPVASAALGRLLTAASFMGAMLKKPGSSVTLRIAAGGPIGSLIAVADSDANVRGYVGNAAVELPLNAKGKLDVGGAVGKNGQLTVIKDLLLKEPYIGQVPLISGEIAEDIASYYAVSEQIPTVCGLGVLVETDRSIRRAGGYLIQLLPAATDSVIEEVEQCIAGAAPVTAMLDAGMSPEDICRAVLPRFHLEVLDTAAPGYVCGCSKQRVIQALISTGIDELRDMQRQESTAVECHFCDKKYLFTPADIEKIIAMAQ